MNTGPAIVFPHRQSAHCESGVAASLLTWLEVPTSEAMAFGIGGGLFFGYLPFIRLNGLPLVTYRAAAGCILRQIAAIPGLKLYQQRFRSQKEAMAALDKTLDQGIPVGLQTGVFWLPYFPKALRFHFNAHNLVVYGKEGDEYLISDPVFPGPLRCLADDLARARFASGALAPKGRMYCLERTGNQCNLTNHIRPAIRSVCRIMLGSPFPLIGVRGIRFLAGRLERWEQRLGSAAALLHLGHVVRMQEEIGTGGAGFRYMYAAFLQESGRLLSDSTLADCGAALTRAGDSWRSFAAMAARLCKGRFRPGEGYAGLADTLRQCAAIESAIFQELRAWSK